MKLCFRIILFGLSFGGIFSFSEDLRPLQNQISESAASLSIKGILGQLIDPIEETQFFLLSCQPKKAWLASEKISDEKTKNLSQAVILAMSSVPRPPNERQSESLEPEKSSASMVFNFDQEDSWADEPEALQPLGSCEYPTAVGEEIQAQLKARAKEKFALVTDWQIQPFEVSALSTDVGFVPPIVDQQIELWSQHHIKSNYYLRLKFFYEQEKQNTSSESLLKISLSPRSATLSPRSFARTELIPHQLVTPWLLK